MTSLPDEAQAVLVFWFDPANREEWFAAHPAFDATIHARFAEISRMAVEGTLAYWAETPQGWLALLIVLDQFPRNLYRNDRRAWAQDLHAQRVALCGIEEGFDRQLPPIQRVFAYMPLEHAEDIGLQQRCIALLEDMCETSPVDERDHYTGFLDYARKHEAVIARFGRFPHRNAVLGRTNTPAEKAYLAEPDAGF